jgi:hypothetical protein
VDSTSSQGQAIVSLLAYATFMANMVSGGGLTVNVGPAPLVFGEFFDSNPMDPVSAATHRVAKLAASIDDARDSVRDRVEGGFKGILGFLSGARHPTPRLYIEAFDTRDDAARGSETATRCLSLTMPIKISMFGKIQATSTNAEIGLADAPWEEKTHG